MDNKYYALLTWDRLKRPTIHALADTIGELEDAERAIQWRWQNARQQMESRVVPDIAMQGLSMRDEPIRIERRELSVLEILNIFLGASYLDMDIT